MAITPDNSLSDLALQKIGRNILNLQKMEGMLKSLVASSDAVGLLSELPSELNELRDSVSKKSMGILVGEFFERIYSDPDEPDEQPEIDEPWMSLRFRIEDSEESVDALKEAFAKLVSERNHLIHEKLMKFDVRSQESCVDLISDLDAQNDRVRPAYEHLQGQVRLLSEMKSVLEQILTEEFIRDGSADA